MTLDEVFEQLDEKKTKTFSDLRNNIGWKPKPARSNADKFTNIDGVNDPLQASNDQDTSVLNKEKKPGRYGPEQVNPYNMFAGRKNIYKSETLDEDKDDNAEVKVYKTKKPKKDENEKGEGYYPVRNEFPSTYGYGMGSGPGNYNPVYEDTAVIVARIFRKYK